MKIYSEFVCGESLKPNTEKIKIESHVGTWYVINNRIHEGKQVFLLESEEYGDGVACLIVDEYCNIILEDVWNGFEDLEDI